MLYILDILGTKCISAKPVSICNSQFNYQNYFCDFFFAAICSRSEPKIWLIICVGSVANVKPWNCCCNCNNFLLFQLAAQYTRVVRVKFFVILNTQFAFNLYVGVVVAVAFFNYSTIYHAFNYFNRCINKITCVCFFFFLLPFAAGKRRKSSITFI